MKNNGVPIVFATSCYKQEVFLDEMRCGYTTGSCVTAGVKACLLALNGEYPNNVIIKSPQDADIEVPIFSVIKTENGYKAIVIKDAGDDLI